MKQKHGFTLIEMLVVTAVMGILAMVSIANFREGEKRKRVALAIDGIVSAVNLAQTYSLAGKSTNNPDADCRIPQYYYITFNYINTYAIFAMNTCGVTPDLIQSYTLPANTRVSTSIITPGLTMNNTAAVTNMRIAFYPPFAQIRGAIDTIVTGSNDPFTTATITIESSDGKISKTATIDGVVGRISQ